MKQIDIIKTYSQKRCLVVEDNADLRVGLKRILVDFGAMEVDTAGNAEETLELCLRSQYDIVLADYNLGKGKNGQQLLEELRHQGLLKNTSIFIMITAESAVQRVILALDHRPDDYLSKPINRDTLRPRLDAALLKNESLQSVKSAIDLKQPENAIRACLSLLKENGRYVNEVKRILGKLLCDQERYDDALELYSEFPEEHQPLWVELGQATAFLGLNQEQRALELLEAVIDKHQYCAEAYDLLAQLYKQKHKFDMAQEALSTAVNLSPISATRQRELGRVCLETGDMLVASHAFRAAIKHSKNSSLERAEDFVNLAQVLLEIFSSEKEASPEILAEALEALKQMHKKFSKQPVIQLRKSLLREDIFNALGKREEAAQENAQAMEINNKLKLSVVGNTSTSLCIDTAKALMARGKYDAGEELLQEAAKYNREKTIAVQIDKLLREPMTKEGIEYAARLNKKGIEFHKNNEFEEAYQAFRQVLHELPNHIGLNLNLIQTLVSKSKETRLSEEELATIKSSFQRVGDVGTESPYRKRFDYLNKHLAKLTRS